MFINVILSIRNFCEWLCQMLVLKVKGMWGSKFERNNDCKDGIMEQWHQKLHNNTSPDDVVICQALIDYINNDFDVSIYWKTLNDNGITKECLLSYDCAICSEPNFRRDQKDGLLRDLRNYMRTLKEPIPVTQLVRKTAAVLQEFT